MGYLLCSSYRSIHLLLLLLWGGICVCLYDGYIGSCGVKFRTMNEKKQLLLLLKGVALHRSRRLNLFLSVFIVFIAVLLLGWFGGFGFEFRFILRAHGLENASSRKYCTLNFKFVWAERTVSSTKIELKKTWSQLHPTKCFVTSENC